MLDPVPLRTVCDCGSTVFGLHESTVEHTRTQVCVTCGSMVRVKADAEVSYQTARLTLRHLVRATQEAVESCKQCESESLHVIVGAVRRGKRRNTVQVCSRCGSNWRVLSVREARELRKARAAKVTESRGQTLTTQAKELGVVTETNEEKWTLRLGPGPLLTLHELLQASVRRLPHFKNAKGKPAHTKPDGSDWSLNDWMTAACGELGEAANIAKKIRRGDFEGSEATGTALLGQELADAVCYIVLAAFRAQVCLTSAIADKWNAVSAELCYPHKLTPIPPLTNDLAAKGLDDSVAHVMEEAGEVVAVAGKAGRFGLDSRNPALPGGNSRPMNAERLLQECDDFIRAVAIMRPHLLDYIAKTRESEETDHA